MNRKIEVHRWSIISRKPFDTVISTLDGAIGRPNMAEFVGQMTAATTFDEMKRIVGESVGAIGLMEFMRLDQGAVLAKAGVGGNPRSVRILLGNPLIMQSMVRLVPDAGSYAPITVLIDQRPDGVHLSYDETVSVLAPYEKSEALKIAHDLDSKVKSLLQTAV
jgi:uncharacterized protein (DUF302 family)